MKLNSPKITVLTPTYNRPDYLKESIGSVVTQTMKDWEMIIVNDGGIDVQKIVESFDDDRITYFNRSKNQGKAACLNFALRRAKGGYIAYLDDDDIWYPNHLETLSEALDKNADTGVVYSDLYAVEFIKDENNGRRYPINKSIRVARDFNRDFMFYFNHTLHVSLMHRKELALRAGGYDENITVLIDWNLTRKLSFYTDFKYIPVVTGEYYAPLGKSDRISNLEREDNERYKHNLRKIKADLPPEPWPKVEKIAVVFPVDKWTDSTINIITELIDNISYPVKFIIVNNDPAKDGYSCKKFLGKIGTLKNVFIKTTAKSLSLYETYKLGVQMADVDYVYLPSETVKAGLEFRLMSARYYISDGRSKIVKWNIKQENSSRFDVLIEKKYFLETIDFDKNKKETLSIDPDKLPESLKFDLFLTRAKLHHKDGNYKLAFYFINEAQAVKKGRGGDQYLIDLYSKICLDLKEYDKAEEECRTLINRGYGADNWIRLGQILQTKKKYKEAVESYRNGLAEIGLEESDLEASVFPVVITENLGSFAARIGLGECLIKTGDLSEAARILRSAARLKANSHRPFLGFGEIFLKSNQLDNAKEALFAAGKREKRDPQIPRLFGELFEKKGEFDSAYSCYRKAFELDKSKSENIEYIYKTGCLLKDWEGMKKILEEFIFYRPGNIEAINYLASVYFMLDEYGKASELVERGLVFDRDNCILKEIYFKIMENTGLPVN